MRFASRAEGASSERRRAVGAVPAKRASALLVFHAPCSRATREKVLIRAVFCSSSASEARASDARVATMRRRGFPSASPRRCEISKIRLQARTRALDSASSHFRCDASTFVISISVSSVRVLLAEFVSPIWVFADWSFNHPGFIDCGPSRNF
jgi:hypothetical protein